MHTTEGRSAISGTAIIGIYQANPTDWLGPFFLGVVIQFFFLGILCCQTSTYFSTFPNDSRWKKGLVGVCLALSILATLESTSGIWIKDILGFGDWNLATSMIWPLYLDPTLMVTLTIAPQLFFAWRCFILTGRNWMWLLFLGAIMLSLIALGTTITVLMILKPLRYQSMHDIIIAMFILAFVEDITITSVIWHQLAKARKGTNKTGDAFLRKWITITYECAAAPAIFQTVNLILFVTQWQGRKTDWCTFFNLLIPRLYVFSLMHTLNSRLPIRPVLDADTETSETSDDPISQEDHTQVMTQRRHVVTLSTFEARRQTSTFNAYGTVRTIVLSQTSRPTSEADSRARVNSGTVGLGEATTQVPALAKMPPGI